MILIEETTVPNAALPVEEFKLHLRLGTGFGQDAVQDEVLAGFLRAAIAAVETRTGKVLMTRAFRWTLNFWRDRDAQGLPVAPVTEITRFAIVDRSGAETDVASALYWLEQDAHLPRLRSTGASLPIIPSGGSAIISFDAGFSATWGVVPPDLKQAVFLLAAHYYEYRNDTSLSDGCMPFGVTSLIERYKVVRLGIGGVR